MRGDELMDTTEKALLIIEAVRNELELGTKHYRNGKLLARPVEILEALRDGKLVIEPTPERRHLFDTLERRR
jgi:hypothetical protein